MSEDYGYAVCGYSKCSIRFKKKREHHEYHQPKCRYLAWEDRHHIKKSVRDRLNNLEQRITKLESIKEEK
jgi:hypothetical protein